MIVLRFEAGWREIAYYKLLKQGLIVDFKERGLFQSKFFLRVLLPLSIGGFLYILSFFWDEGINKVQISGILISFTFNMVAYVSFYQSYYEIEDRLISLNKFIDKDLEKEFRQPASNSTATASVDVENLKGVQMKDRKSKLVIGFSNLEIVYERALERYMITQTLKMMRWKEANKRLKSKDAAKYQRELRLQKVPLTPEAVLAEQGKPKITKEELGLGWYDYIVRHNSYASEFLVEAYNASEDIEIIQAQRWMYWSIVSIGFLFVAMEVVALQYTNGQGGLLDS